MKTLFNIIRIIIVIYVFAYIFYQCVYYVNKKVYKLEYPTFFGYRLIKVDNDNLNPKIDKNQTFIVKEDQVVEEGDLIEYKDKIKYTIKEITKKDSYMYTIKSPNKDDEEIINNELIRGKVIYYNKTIGKMLSFLFNIVTVIIFLVVGTLLPELIFND